MVFVFNGEKKTVALLILVIAFGAMFGVSLTKDQLEMCPLTEDTQVVLANRNGSNAKAENLKEEAVGDHSDCPAQNVSDSFAKTNGYNQSFCNNLNDTMERCFMKETVDTDRSFGQTKFMDFKFGKRYKEDILLLKYFRSIERAGEAPSSETAPQVPTFLKVLGRACTRAIGYSTIAMRDFCKNWDAIFAGFLNGDRGVDIPSLSEEIWLEILEWDDPLHVPGTTSTRKNRVVPPLKLPLNTSIEDKIVVWSLASLYEQWVQIIYGGLNFVSYATVVQFSLFFFTLLVLNLGYFYLFERPRYHSSSYTVQAKGAEDSWMSIIRRTLPDKLISFNKRRRDGDYCIFCKVVGTRVTVRYKVVSKISYADALMHLAARFPKDSASFEAQGILRAIGIEETMPIRFLKSVVFFTYAFWRSRNITDRIIAVTHWLDTLLDLSYESGVDVRLNNLYTFFNELPAVQENSNRTYNENDREVTVTVEHNSKSSKADKMSDSDLEDDGDYTSAKAISPEPEAPFRLPEDGMFPSTSCKPQGISECADQLSSFFKGVFNSTSIRACFRLIALIWHFLFVFKDGKIDWDHLSRWDVAMFANIPEKGLNIGGTLLEQITNLATSSWEFYQTRDVNVFLRNDNEVTTYLEAVELITAEIKKIPVEPALNASLQDVEMRVKNLIVKGEAMRPRVKMSVKPAFTSGLLQLRSLALDLTTMARASSTRNAPFTLLINGTPKIGKSSITALIFKQFQLTNPFHKIMKTGLKLGDGGVYTRTLKEEYWSCYMNSYWGILYDDLGQTNPKCPEFALEINEIIQVVNNVMFYPNMASLEEKGRRYVAPQIVLATSNNKDLNAHHAVRSPGAVLRRFPFVLTPTVRPEFCTDGVLDTDKIKPDDMDLWTFKIEQVVIQDGGRSVTYRVIHDGMSTASMLRWVDRESTNFYRNQAKGDSYLKKVSETTTCEGCGAMKCFCACPAVEPVADDNEPPFLDAESDDESDPSLPEVRGVFRPIAPAATSSSPAPVVRARVGPLNYYRGSFPLESTANCLADNWVFWLQMPFLEEIFKSLFLWALMLLAYFCPYLFVQVDLPYCKLMAHMYMCIIFAVMELQTKTHNYGFSFMAVPVFFFHCFTPFFRVSFLFRVALHSAWNLTAFTIYCGTGGEKLVMGAYVPQGVDIKPRGFSSVLFTSLKSWLFFSGLWYLSLNTIWVTFMGCCVVDLFIKHPLSWFVAKVGEFTLFRKFQTPEIETSKYLLVARYIIRHCYRWDSNDVMTIAWMLGWYGTVSYARKYYLEKVDWVKRNPRTIAIILATLSAGAFALWYAKYTSSWKTTRNVKAQGGDIPLGEKPPEADSNVENTWKTSGKLAMNAFLSPQSKTGNQEWFRSAVENATAHMQFSGVDTTIVALNVFGQYWLVPKHFMKISGVSKAKTVSFVRASGLLTKMGSFVGAFDMSMVSFSPDSDHALIKLSTPPGVNLLPYIIIPGLSTRWSAMNLFLRSDGISGVASEPIVFGRGEVPDVAAAAGLPLNFQFLYGKYHSFFNTRNGDCGTPCIVMSRGNLVILGTHMGADDNTGEQKLVNSLPLEWLKSVRAQDDSCVVQGVLDMNRPGKENLDVDEDVHKKCPLRFEGLSDIPSGNSAIPVGLIKGISLNRLATKVSENLFAPFWKGVGYSTSKIRPVLSSVNVGSWMPKRNFLLNACQHKDLIPNNILEICSEHFFSSFVSRVPIKSVQKCVIIDEETNLYGADRNNFISHMKFDTGAGFPYNKPKFEILDRIVHEKFPEGTCALPAFMKEKIRDMEESASKGERINFVFNSSLKDEPVSEKKLKAGKIRVFQAICVEGLFLLRKYFLSLIALFQTWNFAAEAAIGMDATGPDWDDLHDHLFIDGWKIFCGDYSNYDQRMGSSIMLKAWGIMIRLATLSGNYPRIAIKIMWTLAVECCFCVVNFFGDMLVLNGSNPSGHGLTVVINSICNSIYIRIAWYDIFGNLDDFLSHVRLMTYGDDNIISVHPAFQERFNQVTVTHALAKYGIVYTDAQKTGLEAKPFCDPHEISFLKRGFVRSEHGFWLAPLEVESIHKMLIIGVNQNKVPENDRLASVLISSVMEAFQHGKEFFDTHLNHVHACVEEYQLKDWIQSKGGLPTYSFLLEKRLAKISRDSSLKGF